jgi:hypothetical protein
VSVSFTQAQIADLNEQLGLVQPAYIRLPQFGQKCPFTGLSRSALDLLTRAQPLNNFRPPVRSKRFKQTGRKSGIKLIDYRSLRIYLDGLPDGAEVVNPRRKDLTNRERASSQ